jgi:predicted anti-sigma-YlaC factor YlaD
MLRRSHGKGESPVMTHDRARTALSEWLDSGQSGDLAEPLADHLCDCIPCQQWLQAAEQVTKRVRQARNRTAPDRTEELLAAVLADQAKGDYARSRFRLLIRAGLAAVSGSRQPR